MFSMAMTAWAAKVLDQIDLLLGERLNLLAISHEHADRVTFSAVAEQQALLR